MSHKFYFKNFENISIRIIKMLFSHSYCSYFPKKKRKQSENFLFKKKKTIIGNGNLVINFFSIPILIVSTNV